MRYVLFALVVALGIAAIGVGRWLSRTYNVPNDTDIFDFVTGTWAWSDDPSNCTTDPQVISFTPDRRQMFIVRNRPFQGADGLVDSITVYYILEHTPNRIRGSIPGEARLTESGDPVVWDLVLRAADRYAWHRTDWGRFEYTRDLRRCPWDEGNNAEA
jgi:hypothetical protein